MFGVVPKPLWERVAPADARNRIRMGMRPLLVRGERTRAHRCRAAATRWTRRRRTSTASIASRHLDHALADAGLAAGDDRRRARLAPALRSRRRVHGARRAMASCARASRARSTSSAPASGTTRRIRTSATGRATSTENYVPLRDAGVLTLVDEDGEVTPGVRVRRTGGHTRHHQIVLIESGGKTAVFMADLIPTVAHVPLPWIMGYDLYPDGDARVQARVPARSRRARVPGVLRARPGGQRRVSAGRGTGGSWSSA